MQSFLAYFDVGIVINVAIFVATLVFSQKIKDFFAGVPAHTRASLKTVEAAVLSKVKTFEADLVSTIIPAPAPVVKPPVAAPAPVAPAA